MQLNPRDSQRELNPAYDALDREDPARALKSLDKTLKKHPRFQLARALKALALWRADAMANEQDALNIAVAIRDEGAVDEDVLRVVLMTFKEMSRRSEMRKLLEHTLRLNPTHMTSLQTLYADYGETWEFGKQQSVAMRMYKATGNTKDLLKAITSMLAQREAEAAEAKTTTSSGETNGMGAETLLKLANGMLGKLRGKDEIKDQDSFSMYAMTMALMGQTDEAYDLTKSALADTCVPMPIERERMRARYALKAGKMAEARKHHEKVLELAPDDWMSMNAILDLCRGDAALAEEMDAKLSISGRSVPRISNFPTVRPKMKSIDIVAATKFVESVVANAEEKGGEREVGRGAYILQVDLMYRLLDEGDEDTRYRALAEAVATYHERFGAWTSCAQDMRRYAQALRGADGAREWLIETLRGRGEEHIPSVTTGDDASKKLAITVLRRVTSALLICVDLNACCPSWHGVARNSPAASMPLRGRAAASRFMNLYWEHMNLFADADAREPTAIDVFPYLASCALAGEAAACKENGDDDGAVNALYAAAAALEVGLKKSPYNASLRFSLTAIYTLLGAAGLALETLELVDMKHVQMSTLLHHALPACSSGAPPGITEEFLGTRLQQLRHEIERQVSQSATLAAMNGKYTKVLEFAEFFRTIRDAHSIAAGMTANLMIGINGINRLAGDMDDFPNIDEFRLNMLEGLMEYAEDVCDLTRTNADTARWDEDDELSDAWTYLDDFKTNPAWLAPCGKDPALSSAEWWSNPIETSAHGDENTEIPYAWYFSDARDSLRRRVLLLDAIANRARTEIVDCDATVSWTNIRALLDQLKTGATKRTPVRANAQADLARDVDFALLDVVVDNDWSQSRMDTVFDAIAKLCEWPKNVIESGSAPAMFARGVIPAAFHALSYDSLARFMALVCGGSDVRERAERASRSAEIHTFRRACSTACGVLIADAEDAKSRALAWFAAEASDATEFNSALEDVVERHRASATFALGFARHHIAATVHSPQPL